MLFTNYKMEAVLYIQVGTVLEIKIIVFFKYTENNIIAFILNFIYAALIQAVAFCNKYGTKSTQHMHVIYA